MAFLLHLVIDAVSSPLYINVYQAASNRQFVFFQVVSSNR